MTAIELATGKVPLSDAPALKVMRERLKSDSDPPRLPDIPENPFSPEFREMVGLCLHRDASARPTVQQLLSHRFFAGAKGVDDFRELLSKLDPLSERYATHKRRDENMDRIEQRLEKVPLKISFAFDDSDEDVGGSREEEPGGKDSSGGGGGGGVGAARSTPLQPQLSAISDTSEGNAAFDDLIDFVEKPAPAQPATSAVLIPDAAGVVTASTPAASAPAPAPAPAPASAAAAPAARPQSAPEAAPEAAHRRSNSDRDSDLIKFDSPDNPPAAKQERPTSPAPIALGGAGGSANTTPVRYPQQPQPEPEQVAAAPTAGTATSAGAPTLTPNRSTSGRFAATPLESTPLETSSSSPAALPFSSPPVVTATPRATDMAALLSPAGSIAATTPAAATPAAAATPTATPGGQPQPKTKVGKSRFSVTAAEPLQLQPADEKKLMELLQQLKGQVVEKSPQEQAAAERVISDVARLLEICRPKSGLG